MSSFVLLVLSLFTSLILQLAALGRQCYQLHLPARRRRNRDARERIEDLTVTDNVDETALDAAHEELEELDPNSSEAKAGNVLHELLVKGPAKDMFGGWRLRVALERALPVKPRLLLLGASVFV